MTEGRVVIVAASLAGVRAAETLRREGFTGLITLAGDERHFPPCDRPPLPKQVQAGGLGPRIGRRGGPVRRLQCGPGRDPPVTVEVEEGAVDRGNFVAAYRRAGRLLGARCVNYPGQVVRYQKRTLAELTLGVPGS